jgi:tetratricopeptide (TPR) repeat protein
VRRFLLIGALAVTGARAETPPAKRAKPSGAASASSAQKLAESGHCKEALPLLKTAWAGTADPEGKKRAGVDGLRCAMTLKDTDSALDFVRRLNQQFPHDPAVLYLTVHVFSDLSIRASQQLLLDAPASYQVHALNAEALETQGKWNEAAMEYHEVLKKDPTLPGIHYRLGRLLLSSPQTATSKEEARREFEEELKIDPSNAGAEYILAELARQNDQLPAAIAHFERATRLDAGFGDAFVGLGRALLESGRNEESISPLKIAAQIQPDNPAAHFYLGTAYQRTGRKEEASQEFALHQKASEQIQQTTREIQTGVSGPQQVLEPQKP